MPAQQAPIHSPFGPDSTTDEVLRGIDLAGKTALVTGASAGLGAETARVLAAAGARVILAVRSLAKGAEVAASIRRATGNDDVEVMFVDLCQWASVRALANELLRRGEPLHLLIANAGLMPAEKQTIEGGIEMQFGANHLAHMLLAALLEPLLRKAVPSRVVVLSSAAHRKVESRFEDVHFLDRPYQKLDNYSIAKTANALFALEFNRRLEARGITACSVNPGPVFTGIQAAFTPDEMKKMKFHNEDGSRAEWLKPIPVGAATQIWCAVSPLLEGRGGVYCEDCNIATLRGPDYAELNGVRPWAVDPDAAMRLWAISESLLGEKFAF